MTTSSTGNWQDDPDQRLIDETLDEMMEQAQYNEWHIFEQRNLPEGSSLVAYDEAIRASRHLNTDINILQPHSSQPY